MRGLGSSAGWAGWSVWGTASHNPATAAEGALSLETSGGANAVPSPATADAGKWGSVRERAGE